MAYANVYDKDYPTVAQTRQAGVDQIRTNLLGLRDVLISGGLIQGFNYAPSGGTASQPQYLIWTATGTTSPRLRLTLTWGSSGGSDGNVTTVTYQYAADGTTYESMVDENGKYICTFTYDADGNVTAAAWT